MNDNEYSGKPTLAYLKGYTRFFTGSTNQLAKELRGYGYQFRTEWLVDALHEIRGTEKKVYAPRKPKPYLLTPEQRVSDILDEVAPVLVDVTEIEGYEAEDEDDVEEVELGGRVHSPDKEREKLGDGTYVFTSAQSNTKVHPEFFQSLLTYCDLNRAELMIACYTYNKSTHGKRSVKPGTLKAEDSDTDVWFDDAIKPYISDVSLEVAPDLVWCGELNILPTRINPLSSFSGYTRAASAIIPHAKIAMQSVPTMKNEPAKFLYSTGTVTQRNYIQKTSGQVAEFHHVFGALVVEVKDGVWFARQINATDDGTFYDLELEYRPTGSYFGAAPLAINHGDIHWAKRDPAVLHAMFKKGGILDTLRPKNQFFHDTIDFAARNHHNIKDPHFMFKMKADNQESVIDEFRGAGKFLMTDGYRHWCKSYVVESNHDMAIDLWLKNPAGQSDPANATTWHLWNWQALRTIEAGNTPRPFKTALIAGMNWFMSTAVRNSDPDGHKYNGHSAYDISFLHEDDSMWIKNIQFGLHGHLGPNGARGAPKNLRSVGKANTGHTHSAGIVDGVYTAGVFGKLDMGYNKGLSSWSHSFILTYANGKRTIITIKDGRITHD